MLPTSKSCTRLLPNTFRNLSPATPLAQGADDSCLGHRNSPPTDPPASTCYLLPLLARLQTEARVIRSEFKSDDARPLLQLLNGSSA